MLASTRGEGVVKRKVGTGRIVGFSWELGTAKMSPVPVGRAEGRSRVGRGLNTVAEGVFVGSRVEAGVEAGVDFGVEAGVEAGVDPGVEAGVDPGVEAGVDFGVEAGVDPGVGLGVGGH